jgi:hypothetical protein
MTMIIAPGNPAVSRIMLDIDTGSIFSVILSSIK